MSGQCGGSGWNWLNQIFTLTLRGGTAGHRYQQRVLTAPGYILMLALLGVLCISWKILGSGKKIPYWTLLALDPCVENFCEQYAGVTRSGLPFYPADPEPCLRDHCVDRFLFYHKKQVIHQKQDVIGDIGSECCQKKGSVLCTQSKYEALAKSVKLVLGSAHRV